LSDRFGRRRMGSLFMLLGPIMAFWMYTAGGFSMIPTWILHLFFDSAATTILNAYSAEMFPTSHRSTAGSALAAAGTIGAALGLFLEGVLYGMTHSHWTAVRCLLIFWIISPAIMMFFPETAGFELEAISPEELGN
jgi:MFS transporter, putative metabolite:H+ symporter